MFEKEIKQLYNYNIKRLHKAGSYFTLDQIEAAVLQPSVTHYVKAEINYLIFEDRQKLLKDSFFDYSGDKVKHYFTLIDNEIIRKKRFSFEYISKLILHAISFNANYLAQPKWSLRKFIFGDEKVKSIDEFLCIMDYVHYYDFLKKIIISYVTKKKYKTINEDEFTEILEKIDKLEIESYLQNIIKTALDSLQDFYDGHLDMQGKIPLNAVRLHLQEKRLFNHIEKLNSVFSEEKDLLIDSRDIIELFDRNETEIEEFAEQELAEKTKNDESEQDFFEESEAGEDNLDIDSETDDGESVKEDYENLLTVDDKSKEEHDYLSAKKEIEEKYNITDSGEEEYKPFSFDESKDDTEEYLKNKYYSVEESTEELEEEVSEEPQKLEEMTEEEETLFPYVEENEEPGDDKNETVTFDKAEQDNITFKESPVEEPAAEITDELEKPDPVEEKPLKVIEEESAESIPENIDIDKESVSEPEVDKKVDSSGTETESGDPNIVEEDTEEPSNEEKPIDMFEESEKTNIGIEEEAKPQRPDISEFVLSKNVNKIVENIFEYDMEDFLHTMDIIATYDDETKALEYVDKLLKGNGVSPSSKVAAELKSIVQEYYKTA